MAADTIATTPFKGSCRGAYSSIPFDFLPQHYYFIVWNPSLGCGRVWGGARAAGGSAPQAKIFLRIG